MLLFVIVSLILARALITTELNAIADKILVKNNTAVLVKKLYPIRAKISITIPAIITLKRPILSESVPIKGASKIPHIEKSAKNIPFNGSDQPKVSR